MQRSNQTIDVVLGSSFHLVRPHDLVHALRHRLFERSRFEPLAQGKRCFAKLWSYSWSCDRPMRAYGAAGFDETVALLRSLAPYNETAKPTVLFYARSDTTRRRLLNASAHFDALRAFYGDRYTPVFWDSLWGGDAASRRPSVDEQLHLIRNAARLVTPCPAPS